MLWVWKVVLKVVLTKGDGVFAPPLNLFCHPQLSTLYFHTLKTVIVIHKSKKYIDLMLTAKIIYVIIEPKKIEWGTRT